MRFSPATTENVAVAWIASLDGINTSMVDVQLPEDNSTWATSGFITTYVVGGNVGMYEPLRQPKLMVCCWATTPGQSVPPWGLAQYLAELIVASTYDQSNFGNSLTIPNCDQSAAVLTAYTISEPRRSFGDLGDYACFTFDLQINWSAR